MDDFIRVALLDNPVEAQLLESLLAERDIPHSIQSFHDSALDGIFQLQKGWGCVVASSERREEILDLLAQLRAAPDSDSNSASDAPPSADPDASGFEPNPPL